MVTLSIADLKAVRACDLNKRVADLAQHLGRTPSENEAIPAATWWALPSTSTEDAVWSLRVAQPQDEARLLAVRVAVAAARAAESTVFVECKGVCAAAVEAAEAWIQEPSEERVAAARVAAEDADAHAGAPTAAARATFSDKPAACATAAVRATFTAVCGTDAADAAIRKVLMP